MKAKLEIIGSMAAFGTIGAFVRHIPLPSGELALYRALIAAGAIFLWQLCSGQGTGIKDAKAELHLLILSGAAIGINWILFFEAYRYTTVAMATLSYYFAPVIVTVASPFLFKEKLTARQVFCFIMSTLGLVLVIGVSRGGSSSDLIGILFGLGAAVFYASVVLLNKSIRHVSGINRTFFQFLAASGSHALCMPDWGFPSFGYGCPWGDKSSGGGGVPHRHMLLHVFFIPALSEGPGGFYPQLHRSPCGHPGIRDLPA